MDQTIADSLEGDVVAAKSCRFDMPQRGGIDAHLDIVDKEFDRRGTAAVKVGTLRFNSDTERPGWKRVLEGASEDARCPVPDFDSAIISKKNAHPIARIDEAVRRR